LEYFDQFFINYASIGSFLSFLIAFGATIFLFFLPNRSKATTFLASTFGIIALAGLGYVFSNGSIYDNAWHRMFTLSIIPFRFIFLIQFLLRYPFNNKPKMTRKIYYVTLGSGFLFDIFFFSQAIPAKTYFDITGHSFELNIPIFFKFFSIYILILLLMAFIIGIWKIKINKSEHRNAMIIILIGLFLDLFIPLVLNVLQRNGSITRDTFFTVMAFLTPIGSFLILVAFINTTKDKSTFMFKIVSVSFLTFVLIFNVIIYMFMKDREENYIYNHKKELKLILYNKEEIKNDEVDYILEYNPHSGETKFIYNKENYNFNNLQDRLVNSYLYHSILNLNEESTISEIETSLSNLDLENSKYAQGHKNMIFSFLSNYTGNSPKTDLLNHIESQERTLFFLSNKIKEIPNNKFMEGMQDFIEKNREKYEVYLKVCSIHLKQSLSEHEDLKLEILRYFTPITSEENHYFRKSMNENKFFVAFQKNNDNTIYEIGFSYVEYRKYLHSIGKKLLYLLVTAIAFIFIGTPIFLSGALIKPLNDLLSGLRLVRKGKLDVVVPVRVQDEIGYLATSFNAMVKSIRESKVKLEEYSNQLEEKVEERTRELQFSLAQVELLKTQQDGDYFLTTLLLKPLGVNNASSSEKVKVDFFVKQKKQFHFKQKMMEIGGDICITQSITLRGKKYITFINADAMGKSMQGAGGILVLGAVFHSIVQRTTIQKSLSEVPPEMWIKSTFKELHKIFESFDGSMLVSVIFGLVEEDSGLVYFINAEHPWLVLHRDGVADFIEKSSYFRKLGTSGVTSEIFINTFQMMPGDTLIMGSDGKDDLVLESSESNRVINEDETLFLKRVEETDGDLEKIYKVLTEKFELMDDLSLLSIHYFGESTDEIREKNEIHMILEEASDLLQNNKKDEVLQLLEINYIKHSTDLNLINFLLKTYIKYRMYDKGAEIAKNYLLKNEANIDLMMKATYCLKMSKELEFAIELSERIKLRDPSNIKNLVHLADMYAYTKNYHRAKKLINKVYSLDPENTQVKRIETQIESIKI
jgi:HAMP domain-containing protein